MVLYLLRTKPISGEVPEPFGKVQLTNHPPTHLFQGPADGFRDGSLNGCQASSIWGHLSCKLLACNSLAQDGVFILMSEKVVSQLDVQGGTLPRD